MLSIAVNVARVLVSGCSGFAVGTRIGTHFWVVCGWLGFEDDLNAA